MSETIAYLPPTTRYIDYSAEIPGLESETIDSVNLWAGEEGITFSDFLDVINPLQHLPVISSIYRAVTGDEISLGARLLGGALFGGPIGILTAGVNAAFEEISGGNVAEHATALFEEITGTGDEKPQLALEPQTPKASAVALNGLAPATAQPALPLAPAVINPPVKPSSVTPMIPAMNSPAPVANPPSPLLRSRPQQGAMGLPAALNTPPHNSIAQFGGQSGDAATHRISRSIMEGQRAQAQLLLSSLSGGDKKPSQTQSRTEPPPAAQIAQRRQARAINQQASLEAIQATASVRSLIPARQSAHPNLPPTGAPAAWFQQAMDRGLDRYQNTDNLKRVGQSNPASNP